MKRFIVALMISVCGIGYVSQIFADSPYSISDSDIDKILKAKEIVRGMVNYPDTLVFHEFATKVSGNTVTLKFTVKNGFGVPETHTKDIRVD
jgi:hypothetical protein